MLAKLNFRPHSELSSDCVCQRYEHGVCLLRADIKGRQEIEHYIRERLFLQVGEANRLRTKNRRYRLYMFPMPSTGVDAVMKVSWDNPAYPKWRRLFIRFADVFHDRSEGAFLGALALLRAGVPTIKPIACWTYEPSSASRESYLLYEKIDAVGSARDLKATFLQSTGKSVTPALERLALLVRDLHQQGLWHHDLSLSNFLFSSNVSGHDSDGPIYVIDTDGVSERRIRWPFFSRVREINALRRLNLAPSEIERFLRHYLGPSYRPSWLLLYRFCASQACRPWRPLVRSLKRAGCW
jgi:hypothetical protein